MQSSAETPSDYINSLPPERKRAVQKLRSVIKKNLPEGFREEMSYGMLGYVVPHALYPKGYHVTPELPLPFLNIASQKNHIAVYHMGLYGGPLLEWFTREWKKISPKKLDMGKGCIRFKDRADIPFELIGRLASKMTPEQWIAIYEANLQKGTKKEQAKK
ncbi:MAG: DUF1801 domain-containing protein [Bacteroidota bacterium]|jgi:uncharacterized protein YdhG (YjbR/CyaY superfamily)